MYILFSICILLLFFIYKSFLEFTLFLDNLFLSLFPNEFLNICSSFIFINLLLYKTSYYKIRSPIRATLCYIDSPANILFYYMS